MPAQQKPKEKKGERNPDRKNGKAFKKHPKPQRRLTDEERAERDRKNAERRVLARARQEAAIKANAEKHAREVKEREQRKAAAKRQAAIEERGRRAREATDKIKAALAKHADKVDAELASE
jgi:hypothetical protein